MLTSLLHLCVLIRRGVLSTKRSYRDVPPTLMANSGSWYMNDPLQNAKFGMIMGWFFKIFPNFSQNWLKFKKILEKSGIRWFGPKFGKKLSRLVFELVTSLTNRYLYGFTFKFCSSTSLPKPNLSTPWVWMCPVHCGLCATFQIYKRPSRSKRFQVSNFNKTWFIGPSFREKARFKPDIYSLAES